MMKFSFIIFSNVKHTENDILAQLKIIKWQQYKYIYFYFISSLEYNKAQRDSNKQVFQCNFIPALTIYA